MTATRYDFTLPDTIDGWGRVMGEGVGVGGGKCDNNVKIVGSESKGLQSLEFEAMVDAWDNTITTAAVQLILFQRRVLPLGSRNGCVLG